MRKIDRFSSHPTQPENGSPKTLIDQRITGGVAEALFELADGTANHFVHTENGARQWVLSVPPQIRTCAEAEAYVFQLNETPLVAAATA